MRPTVCNTGEEELYHGTSVESAKQILKEGFVPDKKYNWDVKSKKGFVYLSKAYAPFYAMNAKSKSRSRSLVQVCVHEDDLFPEDDFIMAALGKPVYTKKDLDAVNFEDVKILYENSLKYLGNASAYPESIRVIGAREFDATGLIMTCDPVISPMNYQICGKYYEELTKWIYDGNDHMKFPRMHEWMFKH